jgi:hypothetical protein
MSELDRPVQPPLPRYATDIMSLGLTEEEALEQALQNSAPHPPSPPPPRSTRGLLHLYLHHQQHPRTFRYGQYRISTCSTTSRLR